MLKHFKKRKGKQNRTTVARSLSPFFCLHLWAIRSFLAPAFQVIDDHQVEYQKWWARFNDLQSVWAELIYTHTVQGLLAWLSTILTDFRSLSTGGIHSRLLAAGICKAKALTHICVNKTRLYSHFQILYTRLKRKEVSDAELLRESVFQSPSVYISFKGVLITLLFLGQCISFHKLDVLFV